MKKKKKNSGGLVSAKCGIKPFLTRDLDPWVEQNDNFPTTATGLFRLTGKK